MRIFLAYKRTGEIRDEIAPIIGEFVPAWKKSATNISVLSGSRIFMKKMRLQKNKFGNMPPRN